MAGINPLSKTTPSMNDIVVSNEEGSNLLNAFTKALSSALDESPERQIRANRPRKNKSWRYLRAKSAIEKLNECGSKSGCKSSAKTDSDSSLDNWIDHQMDVSRKVFSHGTDSDEISKSYANFSERGMCPNIGESDSVTESANSAPRVPRKKRKCKRMAIDAPAKNEYLPISHGDMFSQKNKRYHNSRLQKNLKFQVKCRHVSKASYPHISSKMKDAYPAVSRGGGACGKRKRDEKAFEKIECSYYKPHMYPPVCTLWEPRDFVIDNFEDCPGSRHSSSESECEMSTNDESREADDEQSDFFCETGAACGVLKSEDECDDDEDEVEVAHSYNEATGLCQLLETRFDHIPAFRSMYQKSRNRMYEAMKKKIEESGRNVEANQLRLLKAYQSFLYLTEEDLLAEMLFKHNCPLKKK